MSKEILNLEPKEVWNHFYSLTQVPRPSKHEDAIQDFMMKFGKDLGLETIKDTVGNVIIRKPATAGMEDRMGIIMQGHLDMVPQKNNDTKHDWVNDPIDAYIDGDWVTARGTTLGADNGMGVAVAMALLAANNIEHGPVEALFTCDEETGMTGAFGLEPGLLKGDILMNMDSEDEGELYVGCAGGIDASITFDINNEAVPAGMTAYKIEVSGLKGGHSGVDIPLERGNSNKLLFRFMKAAAKHHGMLISYIQGGSLRNAIPRESSSIVVIPEAKKADFESCVKKFEDIFKAELKSVEPDLSFSFASTDMPNEVMSEKDMWRVINSIYAAPNGVMRMSNDIEGVVETSTNLAIIQTKGDKLHVEALLRSSVETAKDDLAEMFVSLFDLAGAKIVLDGEYPGWKPNMDSKILKSMQSTYEKMYGFIPKIMVIHAGLECGLLGSVYPNWDMISFGPTIRFPHSPDEKVNIETVGKFWDFFVETLKSIPVK
ncbi:MAG: cytosol nonspecific dipeptidase [Bacteroidetes bacterium 4572_112]|nr:MAG: cytosol nonspecific dipeptidase [Bacteroidetes bacterium 4572_112]